jgi:hypothetical protein
MSWTKKDPMIAGYYWYRTPATLGRPYIIELRWDTYRFVIDHNGETWEREEFCWPNAEFYGPIPQPPTE